MACTPLTERHWAPMEGHPETFISSKTQQFEPPQLVAQPWAPIHTEVQGRQSAGNATADRHLDRRRQGVPGHARRVR